jgi:hypothetical protein
MGKAVSAAMFAACFQRDALVASRWKAGVLRARPIVATDQCFGSSTTSTPVGSGSCGRRLVSVASLQLARLTTSPV